MLFSVLNTLKLFLVKTYKLLDFSELGEGIHILSLNIETERLGEMFLALIYLKTKYNALLEFLFHFVNVLLYDNRASYLARF